MNTEYQKTRGPKEAELRQESATISAEYLIRIVLTELLI